MASGKLLLRSVMLQGVIVAGFIVLWERNVLQTVIAGDTSRLTLVILLIYAAASVHWLLLSSRVSRERDWLAARAGNPPEGVVGQLLQRLAVAAPVHSAGRAALLRTLEDETTNRHAFGHYLCDVLLKLGLLGTIIGFILMLLPLGTMQSFDSSMLQRLLASMSGGMGVSLYTTLGGLVTHLLLRGQYYLLDAAASGMVNGLALEVLGDGD